jgi:hypothetical protein
MSFETPVHGIVARLNRAQTEGTMQGTKKGMKKGTKEGTKERKLAQNWSQNQLRIGLESAHDQH